MPSMVYDIHSGSYGGRGRGDCSLFLCVLMNRVFAAQRMFLESMDGTPSAEADV